MAESWFSPRRVTFMLAGLIVVAYPDVVLGLGTFYLRDYGFFSYPLAYYSRESFWRGEIPLWNPLSNCGTPFLAQWNTLVCYPPSLIYFVFPLTWALGAFTLLHWLLGAVGMYRLAHRWTGHGLAAAVAGLSFAFNGMTVNCLMWPHITAALGWLPWVVLLTTKAWKEGGRSVPAAGVIGAMQMLTGSPEIILLTWLLLTLLYAVECRRLPMPFTRSAARFALTVLLISVLAAVQLFPFLDLLNRSNRDTGILNTESALPVHGWANFLVPLFRCAKSPAGIFFQPEQFWTTSYYISLGVLTLALLSPLANRRRRPGALASLAFFCVLMSFGDGLVIHRVLGKIFPAIYVINFPVKYLLLVAFLTPLLAAFGISDYLGPVNGNSLISPRRLAIVGGLLVVAITGILLWDRAFPKPYESWESLVANGLLRILFLALALSALHVYRTRGTQSAGFRAAAGLSLLMVLWLDVSTHMPGQNPTVSYAAFQPGLQRLSSDGNSVEPGAGRIVQSREARQQSDRVTLSDPLKNYIGHRLSQSMNCNLLDGNAKVDGFYPLYIKEHLEVVHLLYALTNSRASPLADFLSISHMSSPTNSLEFAPRKSFLPLATVGQNPQFADDTSALAALASPMFDPAKTVYLSPETKAQVRATTAADATILNNRTTPHRIDIEVNAPQATLLVVAQTFYHHWRAEVNGRMVPIWRANHAFQAVELPAGHIRVTLRYVDRFFILGVVLSSLTLFATALVWAHGGALGQPCPSPDFPPVRPQPNGKLN